MASPDHHTIKEAHDAVAKMNTRQRLALLAKLEKHSRHSSYSGPDDLLHEVIHRLATGARNWPVGVDLQTFLVNAGRSIVNSERRGAGRAAVSIDAMMDWEQNGEPGPSPHLAEFCRATAGPSAEQEALDRERIRIVADLNVRASIALAEDALAKQAADGYLQGMKPAEIAKDLNISASAMKAANQRAHRAFMRVAKEMGLDAIDAGHQ